ncbi:HAMP domain-containing histidine kinase [Alkalihalobacillus sp. MEB130]|uniref:HAMP domain-containing sensor histidine kinase n=1 Tax=Alkalihalobacillus sp. MEB130 TaxID=2976704 RepID=UPI0028DDFB8E|nr:HAMP domain-containing sensor histidine kinase [Alkalihalobacillus sp. MEB130]MDT8861386.1 HAMP domain-containing histidine kinase [Alkalihalobacillus sp. MEB130]
MFSFDNYLFALLVVLVPVFVYYSFLYKKGSPQKNAITFGLLCCLSIFLSMTYPLELSGGQIYDLRTIPWLLAYLYGGINMGLVATAFIFLYRFIIGLDIGFIITLFAYSLSSITVYFFLQKYKMVELTEKLKISFLLTLLNTILVLIGLGYSYQHFDQTIVFDFVTYFLVSHLLTILIVIYIIETLQEKEQNKSKLLQAERVKIIGEMAASVAHEVRNPLTVVKGFIYIFKTEKNLTTSQISSLELMDTELQRAETIIHNYLSLAKSKTSDMEKIDVIELVQSVVCVMNSYALLKGITIVNNLEGSYYIKANRCEVNQVFLNIIKNGIESIDGKGHLILRASKKGNSVTISITDNGKGMTEEEVKRLGSPFYTTKDYGTGLGTMVCYKIVDNLQGEIKVKSSVNVGTTFSIFLPLVR